MQSVLCHCLVYAGTGLLQEVVYLVSQGADPDEIGLMNIDEQLPVLEYPQPGLDIIKVQFIAKKVVQHLAVIFLGSIFITSFVCPCPFHHWTCSVCWNVSEYY